MFLTQKCPNSNLFFHYWNYKFHGGLLKKEIDALCEKSNDDNENNE